MFSQKIILLPLWVEKGCWDKWFAEDIKKCRLMCIEEKLCGGVKIQIECKIFIEDGRTKSTKKLIGVVIVCVG